MRNRLLLLLLFVSGAALGQTNLTGFGNRAGIAAQKPKQNNAFLVEEGDSVAVFVLNPLDKLSVAGTNVIVDANGNRFIRRKVSGTVSGPAQNIIVPAVQTALNAKENTIAPGSIGQYFRYNKTWADLNAAAVGLGNVPNVNATNAANLGSGLIPAARFGSLTIPLSAFSQSGATNGQVPTWNGSAWVPGTVSGGGSATWPVSGTPSTFPPSSHTHAAGTDITGLSTVAISGAYNDLAGKPTLGTGAALNVAASGNAASGELVKGNDTRLSGNQPTLVSGTNIKTINGNSLLGSGDITISGGSGGLSEPATNGFVVRTGSGSTTARSLTAPAAGISISNSDAVAGNPTFALINDLGAIEALTGTGLLKRTGTDTWGFATAGTDYLSPTGSAAGLTSFPILNQSTTGNAATVTNGVYTTGSYSNPAWITGLDGSKISGTIASANIVGALSGKTYNGLNLTTTTGTFTLGNSKTFSVSNSLTLAGTDGSTLNIGAGGALGALAYLGSVNNSNWSGAALGLGNGGSGQTTAQAAMNAFAGAVTSGLFLRGNGTNVVMGAIQAGDLPTGIDATKLANGTVTSTELQYINSVTSNVQTQLDAKAPLASPGFTGAPTAPTATAGTNNTQIATTAFVTTAVGAGSGKNYVTPEDYGAAGNGSTNDLTAFTNMLAANTTGRIVLKKGANYRINGTLTITANGDASSNLVIEGYGAKITTTNASTTAVLRFYHTKRLTFQGVEVQGLIDYDGMWESSFLDCNVQDLRFGYLNTDTFDEHYWNTWKRCQIGQIIIYTGSSGDLTEFNSNSFYQCKIWSGAYAVKIYGTEIAQGIAFYDCDISYQTTSKLYVDVTVRDVQINLYTCYLDDDKGFPYNTKGVTINTYGAGNTPNSALTQAFTTDVASQVTSDVQSGVRNGSRLAVAPVNLIKNGDFRYGTSDILFNSWAVTQTAGTGMFGKYVRLTASGSATSADWDAITAPYTGIYSLTVTGRNVSNTVIVFALVVNGTETLYNPVQINDASNFVTSSCQFKLTQGQTFKMRLYSQASVSNTVDIAYVGLTYGRFGVLQAPAHPEAEGILAATVDATGSATDVFSITMPTYGYVTAECTCYGMDQTYPNGSTYSKHIILATRETGAITSSITAIATQKLGDITAAPTMTLSDAGSGVLKIRATGTDGTIKLKCKLEGKL